VDTLQQEYETECATVCKGEPPMCLLGARTAADICDRRSARQHAAQVHQRWQGVGG
jgi:hypothetical protein